MNRVCIEPAKIDFSRRMVNESKYRELMRDGEWLVPESERPQLAEPPVEIVRHQVLYHWDLRFCDYGLALRNRGEFR